MARAMLPGRTKVKTAPQAIALPLIAKVYAIRDDLDVAKKEILRLRRRPIETKERLAIVGEDQPINTNQLAAAMSVDRSTVWKWKKEGYRFEFGTRTTVSHCKEWLRNRQSSTSDDERTRRAEFLRSLR
jgi:hypothetical protein